MIRSDIQDGLTGAVNRKDDTVKNEFFTDKFVLTPKFAGVGSMEVFYD